MNLSRIKLTNFKNYSKADLTFDQKVNIIYGNNGSGKTNFLDAIHFLSVSKSYFGLSDKYLINGDEDFFRIEGYYEHDKKNDLLVIKYKRDQKRDIQINRKKLPRVSDLIGRFPVVLIAPDDINIVKGGSKERRDYFNKWLCQGNSDYLSKLMIYNRLLRQKDALLKGDFPPSRLAVESFNHKMAELATDLHKHILEAMAVFIPHTLAQYNLLSNGKNDIDIVYMSELSDANIPKLFDHMISAEIMAKRPLIGVQRDDYDFLIEERAFKKYGSQGQIKSLLYSLRLAEFAYLKEKLGQMPLLILDDFFEKLDNSRLSALLTMINQGDFGQVFLSDTELNRSKEIFQKRGISFGAYFVEDGTLERIE